MSEFKILSILPILLPASGGCATYSEGLMKSWAKADTNIKHSVLTEYQGDLYYRKYASNIVSILPKRRLLGKMNFIYLIISYIAYRIIIAISIVFFRLKGYSILHIHSSISTFMDIFIARLLGFKVTVDLRDTYFKLHNLIGANKLIGCSLAIEEKAKAILPKTNFSYLPIPVDFEELNKFTSINFDTTELPFALYLGVISKNKGVDIIISAFLESEKFKSKSCELILAGPLQDPEIINNLPDRISYIGLLDRFKAINAICEASLLVVTGAFEGMPRVAIEGIILKTPVILPPGIKELEKLQIKSILGNVDIENLVKCFDAEWDNFRVNKLDLSQFELSKVSNQTLKVITG